MVDGFWYEGFWLPENITWKDVAYGSGYTNPKHLYLSIPFGFLMLMLRYYLERYCFIPIGVWLGIKITRAKSTTNSVLQKSYALNDQLDDKQVQNLSEQLEWSERKVQRWFRIPRRQGKISTLIKFSESCWKCLYFTVMFTFGLVTLWNKPFLWDTKQWWFNYVYHHMDDGIWWYYILSLSFYTSQCVSQFFDVKKKDFWQTCLHHIVAIMLLWVSWISNFHRYGIVILLTHDCSDPFLEVAKIAKYLRYRNLADKVFVLFTLVWVITRLGILPFWVMKSGLLDAPKITSIPPVLNIVNGFLIILIVLHLFWTYLIFKIAYGMHTGQAAKDVRSSSSESESSKSQ